MVNIDERFYRKYRERMHNCPNCGKLNFLHAKKCWACGKAQAEILTPR